MLADQETWDGVVMVWEGSGKNEFGLDYRNNHAQMCGGNSV
jgi:hypothetical protein